MANYRYDNIQFLTTIPNMTNIGTPTGSIAVSGTIISGGGQVFGTTVPLSSNSTFSDIYITNTNTGNKTQLVSNNAIDAVYQYTSTETVTTVGSFLNTSVEILIQVLNNTGSTITLIPQQFTLQIVEYALPW